jgi:adenylate cyclase
VIGLRAIRLLEALELAVYDALVRTRSAVTAPSRDSRILVVTITERDIQEQGAWPLSDGVLARTLEVLAGLGPRAIGLDIYRDVPVAPGSAELDRLLRREPRIVGVTKFAEGSSAGVGPPGALKGTPQVGFNDIVVDSGGIVRRALLFLDDGETVMYSFPLRLGLLYLQPAGRGLGPDPADETVVSLGGTAIPPLGPNDGPYVRVDAAGYQFLADFLGGLQPFDRVELGTVLRGEVAADSVRDRVVLVGVTAESVRDDFYTPLSASLGAKQHVPGVEVHAQFVSQLLRIALDGQRPVGSPPEWMEWLCVCLWSVLGALIATRHLRPWQLAVAFGLGLVGVAGSGYLALLGRWWWPVVPPGLTWIGAIGLVVAYQSHRERAERGILMRLFSQHVSKEVAEAIWRDREQFAHGGRPRPRSLVVTALFTDLAGFTSVSERFSPEALMDWLNEYMDVMAQEISRHNGVIRQYAGDSIVALFGVPVPRSGEAEISTDAINAVRCALAMERKLIELNQRWQAAEKPPVGMRIGIVTGGAVGGTLGSIDRWEYVVVGDTLNTAARLESFDKEIHPPDPLTRPCRILISGSTYERVGTRFEAEWVTEARLKGKQQLVAIYRVVGERQDDPSAAAMEPLAGSRRA